MFAKALQDCSWSVYVIDSLLQNKNIFGSLPAKVKPKTNQSISNRNQLIEEREVYTSVEKPWINLLVWLPR